jgi:hypothetical protein
VAAIVASFYGTEFTARVFTSSAFYIVYGLLALNFLLCTWKHLRSPRRNTAFVLIHMGTLLVIGGASYGHFYQVKGNMWIEQQSGSNRVLLNAAHGGETPAELVLPFEVFLDRFWIQYYPRGDDQSLLVRAYPDFNAIHAREPGLILPLENRPGAEGMMGDTRIRVEKIIPHAKVESEEKGDPLLVVELEETGERITYPVRIGEPIRVDALNAVITPKKIYRDAKVRMQGGGLMESSDLLNNPALHVEVELPAGGKPVTKYLFSKFPEGPGSMMVDHDKGDSASGSMGKGYRLVYRSPEMAHSVVPMAGSDLCAVLISASREGKTISNWYSPSHGLLPAYRTLFEGMVLEVLDLNPPHVSDYKSKLTVYEEGEMVTSKIVEVNHPLTYRGYTFYQSSYDKEGERFTVLQVVKDPGVWLVMVGFACIMLGVIQKFYIRPFLRNPGREVAGDE